MKEPSIAHARNATAGSAQAAEQTPPMPDTGVVAPGAPQVPDYELLRRIGGGAYGEVWLARSKATGTLRAAKIVWRHRFEDDRPFQREFEGIQKFERISREHASQLALFHIGRNDAEGYFYYVMELADDLEKQKAESRTQTREEDRNAKSEGAPTDGEIRFPGFGVPADFDVRGSDFYEPHTLRADLAQGRLPTARVLEIGLALAEALGHLHEHGLVHRDVKPSNVIFVNGRPKLADIGLVTDASDQCSIVGTEGYLPPEGPGTPRADIFALGKVLYEAATGMDRREFPSLPSDVRSWPEARLILELNQIVLTACASDARTRYASTEAILGDLRLLQSGSSVRRHRARQTQIAVAWKAVRAAAVVVAIAAGGVFLWQTISRQREPAIASTDFRAANAYQRGYRQLRLGTASGFHQATGAFAEAIKIDPGYVPAYAGLFEAYLMDEDRGISPVTGRSGKLDELSAALAKIARTNAEAHAGRAIVLWLNERRWNEAGNEFNQALQADPGSLMVLTCYGRFLTQLGSNEVAHRVMERASRLDPTSPLIRKLLGECEVGMSSPTNRDWPPASNAPTSQE